MAEGPASGRRTPVMPGEILGGKYKVVRVLGAGGMGVVVAARHVQLGKTVAIKILRGDALILGVNRARFEREGRVLASLTSEHVAKVHDVGALATGEPYLVMDLLEGETLGDRIRKHGHMPPEEVVTLVLQACEGLAEAHAVGVIHRDLKPDNLFICKRVDDTEIVKVLDFGISKATEAAGNITVAGLVGTPAYMAPEQLDAPSTVDARADVWSIGALMYEAITGRLPFDAQGQGVLPIATAILTTEPKRIDAPGVAPELADVVQRCLSKRADDRYSSIVALARALAPFARGDTASALVRMERTSKNRATPSGATHASWAEHEGPVLRPSAAETWAQTGKTLSRRQAIAIGASVVGVGVLAGGSFLRGRFAASKADDASAPLADAAGSVFARKEPIRIGVLHSLTGTMAASESSLVDAVLLAIAKVNASGGLLGRQVEPVVRDGRSHADSFVDAARGLLDESKVSFVFGCWTSAARRAVRPLFEERRRLLFYSVQYEGLESSPSIVYLGASPNQQLIPAVRWAFAFMQRKSFFLVGSDYVFPRVATEIIKDQLKLLGASVAGEAFLPLGTSEVGPVVERICKSGATMILNMVNGDTNVAFLRALRAAGVRPEQAPLLSFSLDQTGYRDLDPSIVAGDYLAWSYFEELDSAENRDFLQALHDRFGPLRPATDPMATSYSAVLLWAEAVRRAESLEPAAVRAALNVSRVSSPLGELRIDPATGHAVKGIAIGQIERDGKVQVVWSAPKAALPTPFPETRTREAWEALLSDLQREWGGRWEAPEKR